MEGYLIRLPACAWDTGDDSGTATRRNRRVRRSCKPQARLLYYSLGEGFLEGFASPDDMEPIESFQLTSFEVDVDPVYSLLMFKVTTHEKRAIGAPPPPAHHTTTDGDSSDEEDDHHRRLTQLPPNGSSLLLFAGSKELVEVWCKKLLNWNRYVFAGALFDDVSSDLTSAKSDLIAAFHEKNNSGMFTILCDLTDCTKPVPTPDVVPRAQEAAPTQAQQPPLPSAPVAQQLATHSDKLSDDVTKRGSGVEIKPLWLLLHRNPSRRISAVPLKK